jgi:NAD-dependent dihydropyrimidine dehydrogenase PreA subunit
VTYVIAVSRMDIKDRACVEECPVDCIREGTRSHYVQPDECIDRRADQPVRPVEAIYYEDDLPKRWVRHTADNARFFTDTLAGLDEPLGSPGGAAKLGPIAADAALVANLAPNPQASQNGQRDE